VTSSNSETTKYHPAMAVRKTTTIEKLETGLVALRSRHSTLNERKAEAQSALDRARADQQKFLLESDISNDRAIAKLENAVDAATLRLSGLSDACAALAAQIADAEQEIATETEREEREAAARDIKATTDEIQERLDALLREIRNFGESLVAANHIAFEVGECGRFLRGVAGEIELAVRVMVPQLRGLAGAVERGEARIPRRPA
jgi:chromosome segregation ATPase